MQQLVAALLEFSRRRSYRSHLWDVELEADLMHPALGRPLRRPEARFGGLGEWPDTEGIATGDLLAVLIIATVLSNGS